MIARLDASKEQRAAARGRGRVDRLLDALCSDLGFCLSPAARQMLLEDPFTDVDSFTIRVMAAVVAAALDEVTFMRVAWPDGEVIADVEVSSNTDPVHTAHVMGTFAPGPGWARLNIEIQRMQECLVEGSSEVAVAASEAIDHLAIYATDELGRRYRLFNVQFSSDLLFGAARDGW